jgi:uncharacterized membrane protein affecting hemolysin expression
MRRQQLNDLSKLARQRARESVSLVTQLTDTDEESASILLSVAVDFIGGAGVYLSDGDVTHEGALTSAVHLLVNILGPDKVAEAVAEARTMIAAAEKRRAK